MRSSPSEYSAIAEHLFAQKAHGTKFGIDRMRALATALEHPEKRTPCIHIAGTNGKGSVAAMIESILRAAGWRVGLYTSPHLVHLGERVQVNRTPLREDEIVDYMRELQPVADRIAAADANLRPSFFEFMTAMALLQFVRQRCDVAVLEVGLGGRLDATNVVLPEIAVITSIARDHCEILGHEIAQIAAEKAGILKPGVPVILGRVPREADDVIRGIAAQSGAELIAVEDRFGTKVEDLPRTNLEGEYQRWNAATATLVARALAPRWRVTDRVIEQGLQSVDWPGRWQRMAVAGRTVIVDASHNIEGAQALDLNLAALSAASPRRCIVVVGILGRERARPLLAVIARHAREIHLVVAPDSRACGFDELESDLPAEYGGVVVRDEISRLFPKRDECSVGMAGDTIVVTGSIYLAGQVLKRLQIGG